MNTPVDGKREGLGIIPEALSSRSIIVPLKFPVKDRSALVVEKWSAQKLLAILKLLSTCLDFLTPEQTKAAQAGNFTRDVLPQMMAALGDRSFALVELSVAEDCRSAIRELDADDFVNALDAVVRLNLTDNLVGKVIALGSDLFQRFKRAAKPIR